MTNVAHVASAGDDASNSGATPSRAATDAGPSARLQDFDQEIRRLRVKGGKAEPERRLLILGVVLVIAGFAVSWSGIVMVRSAESGLDQGDGLAQTMLGIGVAVVGAVLWARYSLSRYLRYWLIRQIYEDRASTDRIVEAIERGHPH